MKNIPKSWRYFLLFALFAGALLRLLYVDDMEYKHDEEYNFRSTQIVRGVTDWPASGMASGVHLKNPGMSIWVYIGLAKLSAATTPTELARALQILSLLGICLIIPFAQYFLKTKERTLWYWAFALAMVNPFAVYIQRKLWPEPFFPFFSMIFLMAWWRREARFGAFLWGVIGAWLGQIHMSGFFYAFSFFLWTVIHERIHERIYERLNRPEAKTRTRWSAWFLGSIFGALPLIPWALELMRTPLRHSLSAGIGEALQFKYWVFWLSNPTGLHLGNPLGLHLGDSAVAQLSDFVRYPLLGGTPTYLNGVMHLMLAGLLAVVFLRILLQVLVKTLRTFSRKKFKTELPSFFFPKDSNTALALSAALWGCGLFLTATLVKIRRYYMMVTFPFEFIWMVGLILRNHTAKNARVILTTVFFLELFISGCFVGYVHINKGAPNGDYGDAYHVIMKKRRATTGP